ncbi:MAG: fumarylacetoacetate hydrolase family protein [Hyphomicrobiales bacterium]|nr:fumarylacetoacetate hydrolase family protein [Hyphomicrobiales bacterium]OQW80961.1 MAG: 2-keto-4-pentenoate hydratase [Proteobacteria bacterium ST_bin15]
MKLASMKGGRDGRLVVVSDDLTRATDATTIAPTLQAALDDWDHCEPLLRQLAESLAHDAVPSIRFHERDCAAPLPRAYQWVDGSAYLNHVELVRKARGADMPSSFLTDPLMYQGASDGFMGPRDPIRLADAAWGIDFEAEIVVITGDVPMGIDPLAALAHIRLVLLVNDVSLRNLIPAELAKGFGFLQGKPSSSFSPVAVTPDALGSAWQGGRLDGTLLCTLNGRLFGKPNTANDMNFDFGRLISHAAKTRSLAAGTLVGAGTVSNRGPDGGPGTMVEEGGLGYACIAERRCVETIRNREPATSFMVHGDRVRIEMLDAKRHSIFGAIEQSVEIG